ncbi:cytochrome P450 [Streptomyces wuyuanensis]|uniref:cytochrome P450 n=1 Tax=Streptomyces wuyuanensis TaxID=1196353 RepID=UPI00342EA30E
MNRWLEERRPIIDLLRQAHSYGDMSSFSLHQRRMVLITHPDHVMHALVRQEQNYRKRSHRAGVLLGRGLLTADGAQWARHRRLLQPQFSSAGVRRFQPHITDAAQRTAHLWDRLASQGSVADITAHFQFFALDTIWRAVTGDPLDEATYEELRALEGIIEAIPDASGTLAHRPISLDQEIEAIDRVAYRAITRARAGHCHGVLCELIRAGDLHPPLSDRQIRDELVTLLVAGHETTAKTLAWTYLLLATNPEVESAIHATLHSAKPTPPERTLNALAYEVLRLYPVAWLIPRHVVTTDLVNGWCIPSGSEALICPYLTHRDPKFWSDPDDFDPQRFAEPAQPCRRGTYYPFGVGQRTCLGQQFALQELRTLLALLLRHYHLELTVQPTALFGSNLRPADRLTGRVHRR